MGEVAQPSRRPLCGVHGVLSSCLPFTRFCVFSCKPFRISKMLGGIPSFPSIPHKSGLFVLGYAFFMSKSTAPGLLGSGWLDLPRTLLVSSSILIIVCVASAVDLFFLKPFWFSSNAPISSAHSLILEASTLAMIRLAKGRRQMPL